MVKTMVPCEGRYLYGVAVGGKMIRLGPIGIDGGEVYSVAVRVEEPLKSVHGGHDIHFILTDADQPSRRVREKARFIAPP